MGWAVGYDSNWKRDIGYGVPAVCDHHDCGKLINRGLAHVCGCGPYGGDTGCGLYFCGEHGGDSLCARCTAGEAPYEPTRDTNVWMQWKLRSPTWYLWRTENPKEVKNIRHQLKTGVVCSGCGAPGPYKGWLQFPCGELVCGEICWVESHPGVPLELAEEASCQLTH